MSQPLTPDEQALYQSLVDKPGPLIALRRALCALPYRLPDSGLFGLTPLQRHVLVCGFPRSGTTMLLAMLEHAYPTARRFGREVPAWRAATATWRNHPLIISKLPKDLLRIDSLRSIYRRRKAELKTILVIRDPRDILTSRHAGTTDRTYFCQPPRFRCFYRHYQKERHADDVLVIRYEQLLRDVPAAQARIESFIGAPAAHRFATFHEDVGRDFDATPLNGVRPPDLSSIGRWRNPRHRQWIHQLLHELPELPQVLMDMGYERDTRWLAAWNENNPRLPHSDAVNVA